MRIGAHKKILAFLHKPKDIYLYIQEIISKTFFNGCRMKLTKIANKKTFDMISWLMIVSYMISLEITKRRLISTAYIPGLWSEQHILEALWTTQRITNYEGVNGT